MSRVRVYTLVQEDCIHLASLKAPNGSIKQVAVVGVELGDAEGAEASEPGTP